MSIIYIFSFLVDRPQFYKPISVLDLCLSLSYRFTCCLVSLKIGPCSSPFCFSGNCSFLTCIIWFIIHVFTFYALQLKVFIFALLCKEILAFVWCYRTIDFMFGYNLVTIWEFFSFMRKMLFSFSITFFLGGGGGGGGQWMESGVVNSRCLSKFYYEVNWFCGNGFWDNWGKGSVFMPHLCPALVVDSSRKKGA